MQLYQKVRILLYNLTGITLADNKDIMISNRLHKLKRDTNFEGSTKKLLDEIKKGKYIDVFINSFTTNKTHFFREDFHFVDLTNRILPEFANDNKKINMYCSASSTGEEAYSMAMTILQTSKNLHKQIKSSIIATDIDTNALKHAVDGVYKFSKSSKEFPSWINPADYFQKRVVKTLSSEEILIKVKKKLHEMISFQVMNLNRLSYPFRKNQFDVIFCRNVLIYFSAEDQNVVLKKLFTHLKIGGTLYMGHSESPQDLINYTERIGDNIFVKTKDFT